MWWADPITYACIAAYGLAVWWPTRALPYYWDSATFVVDAARQLLATGFHPFIATHSDFAHPPLLVALVALSWKVFGESREVAHALMLPALPAAMMATYRLGSRTGDRSVGAAAAFLFGGVAVVLAEVGQVYMDLPIAAVLAWGLLAWMSDRPCRAAVLFTAAALMKIPAPLTVPGALMLVVAATPGRRRDAGAYLALAVPFAVDALWLAYHAAVTGWFVWRPGRRVPAPHGLLDRLEALRSVVAWLLLGQWRWALLAAAVLAFLWKRVRRPGLLTQRLWPLPWACPWPPASQAGQEFRAPARARGASPWGCEALLAPIVAGVALFASVGEFGLRYGIYLLPPYLVLCLVQVRSALGRSGGALLGLAAGALFAGFATTWHPRAERTASYVFRPDENLAYQDMIAIGRRSARWLETKHADDEIYGAGPEAYELSEPWQGYVTRPLGFARCIDFERHPGARQLVLIHAYHPQQPLCRRIIEATGAEALVRFEANGKWVEVWQVP